MTKKSSGKQSPSAPKRAAVYLDSCKFFIDPNGLLPIDAFKPIFTKIDPAVMARLNEVLNGVKVSVGGIRQRRDDQKGYLSHSSYEFNFKDQDYNDED